MGLKNSHYWSDRARDKFQSKMGPSKNLGPILGQNTSSSPRWARAELVAQDGRAGAKVSLKYLDKAEVTSSI